MERNDASIPWFSLILAAVFWVILLFLFNGELAKEEAAAPAAVAGKETAVKVDWQGNGKALYTAQGCVGCHGAQGQGGVGKVLVGSALVLGKPDGLVGIIQKGKNLMPAYPQFSEQQVLEVTNFVRNSWTNKGGEFGAEVFAAAGAGENEKALKNRSRFVPKDLKLPEIFLGTFIMVLLVYGPALFAWAFGESWRGAGELARALAPYIGMHFIASPLAVVTLAWRAQGWALRVALGGRVLEGGVRLSGSAAASDLRGLAGVAGNISARLEVDGLNAKLGVFSGIVAGFKIDGGAATVQPH